MTFSQTFTASKTRLTKIYFKLHHKLLDSKHPSQIFLPGSHSFHPAPMASRSSIRPLLRSAKLQCPCAQAPRYFSRTAQRADAPPQQPSGNERTTHFGFETVPEMEKEARVAGVFSNVATYVIWDISRYSEANTLKLVRYYERLHVSWDTSTMEVGTSSLFPIPSYTFSGSLN